MLRLVLVSLLLTISVVKSADQPFNLSFVYQGSSVTLQGLVNKHGYSFSGIPYAQPPVGNLRFKSAQSLKLSGFYDARIQKPWCVQHDVSNGTEDCLYLNVYAPINDTLPNNLPVYVFIHGGAFVGGGPFNQNDMLGPFVNLINRGPLIMVTITYRLGPFGFFATRDSVAPGNAALTDMIAALQWVQDYIRFFGGDPSQVTIGGQSAGSIACSFLTMTRKADQLFRAALMESGSAFLPTFMSYSEKTRNSSMIVAVSAGCATQSQWNAHDLSTNFNIVECLRKKTANEILAADSHLFPHDGANWGMVIDPDYLPERLETAALKRRPIPVIHGVANLEWLSWVAGFIEGHNLTAYTRQYVDSHLNYSYAITSWDNPDIVYQQAKKIYVDSINLADNDNVGWCVQHMHLWSEMNFMGPSLRDAKYFAFTGSPTYLYSFDTYPLSEDLLVWDPRLRGAFHGVDLQYAFDLYGVHNDDVIGSKDTVTEIMGRIFTNFILTGFVETNAKEIYSNPTPPTGKWPLNFKWETMDDGDAYLSITEKPTMGRGFYSRSKFWSCTAPAIDGIRAPFC